MAKKLKFKHYVETLLQIIEDKSKQNFPVYFYYALILIMYCQFSGYIFSTYETKPLVDSNIRYFAHIMEYSTGTFLLFVTANDTLTLLVFVIFEFCLYGYIFYIVVLTYIRLFHKEFIQKLKPIFKIINYILQIIFSCFLWIFYIPFTEIHAGMAVCGSNSFLSAYRGDDGCDKKPTYQIVLGVLGIALTFFTGCLLNYFYVSYEFQEKNLLKRRFSWNLMIQMMARSILVIFYYLKVSNIALIKHITSHILGITSCFDVIMNLPFRNKKVMLFYGSATFVYESTMALFSVWNLTDILAEYNLFYFWCILISLGFGLMNCYWGFAYYSLMKINSQDIGSFYYIIDQYLEEVSSLAEKSDSDKVSKLKICGILRNHLNICNEPHCIFKKNSHFEKFLDENFQIDSKKLIKIINNWFTVFLNHDLFKKNQTNREYLSLKYCSFLANFQDNPIRAYYELKTLLNKDKKKDEKSDTSLFFRLLSKIISRNIENLIIQQIRFEQGLKGSDEVTKKHEFFYSVSLYKLEKFKKKYVQCIIDVSNSKREFWEKLLNGYNTIDEYHVNALKLAKKINRLKAGFFYESKDIQKTKDRENIIFLKMTSIFNTVILNDVLTSYKIENKMLEIKKRESVISKECISSLSIVKGNSITITASLLNETGKIMSKKDEKTASFFEYNFEDFENLDNISSLMPVIFARNHSKYINRYIESGRSECVRNSRLTFCQNYLNEIFPVKIFYNFIFDYVANFGICAAITKLETSSYFILFDIKGNISGVSKDLITTLKIKDNFGLFNNSTFNILKLAPNLFDNVNFANNLKENDDSDLKDVKSILVSHEKFWLYPPRCEVKNFLENFNEFVRNKENKSFDITKTEERNIFKNFLINEDSKSNLRKVLASANLFHNINYLNDGTKNSYYVFEIIEIFLNQMMDPDQSTGLRLTENLTENSKNKKFEQESEENENSHNELKSDVVINQSSQNNLNYALSSSLPKNTYDEILQSSQKNETYKTPENDPQTYFHTPEENAPNQMQAIFDKPSPKRKDDESIMPIPFSKDQEDLIQSDIIKNLSALPSEGNPKTNIVQKKIEKGVMKKGETDENDMRDSFSMDKDKDSNKKKGFSKEDKFLNAVSVSSGSSLQTNYGSVFLKDLVQGNYNPSIVKKILFISIFQILFFFTINLIYIFLLNDRLVSFKQNVNGMETPHYFLNSYSRVFAGINYEYLQKENIISTNLSFKPFQNELKSIGYNIFQSKLNEFKSSNYYYSLISIEKTIHTFSENKSTDLTLDYFQFLNLINEQIFLSNLTNFDYDNYLFFLSNYQSIFSANAQIESNFLSQAQDNKDSLSTFYLVLSIVGLTVAIFLQLINIPFFLQYYGLIEKILMVVARVTEPECIHEIKIYENYLNKLKSKKDEYLNYEFLLDEKNPPKKTLKFVQANITANVKKNQSNFSSGYLSSRITNQKLKRTNTHLLNLLTIIIVTIFFSVVFVFSNVIQGLLQNSIFLDQNMLRLSNSLDVLESLPEVLIPFNFTSNSQYLKPNEWNELAQIYQDNFFDFNVFFKDIVKNFGLNTDIGQTYRDSLQALLTTDLCQTLSISLCSYLSNDNFLYGMNGDLAIVIKDLREKQSYIIPSSPLNMLVIVELYNMEILFQNLINTLILLDVRDRFIEIGKNALDDRINTAYQGILLLFLLGGSACSIFLSVIFLLLYFKIKSNYMNLRSILLLIPFKKLREDSTLYLLRNLQKF